MASPATNGTNTAPANKAAAAKRFELPALNFKFGSLTEGTDIPPPLPSPIQEEPTPLQTESTKDKAAHGTPAPLEGESLTTVTAGNAKRPGDAVPLSPAPSSRGSLRKYLSKSLLNSTYEEHAASANGQAGSNGQAVAASRPPSRTASVLDGKKARRGSGWFRRLRSSDGPNKRMSQSIEDLNASQPAPTGPPPPSIPEMSQWKSQVDTSLGDDLFKSIR
ncbi:hypothetical protein Micbo1qcDRAFT_39840 [Microdochium bolleyi]|uniref:Uncharacterized protein n=1 Tax=Microdochium bolleyi TaxID=196109 RepID=A0A136JA13_9PEZI|nr:hypothetical protein Micbo1qcDRAFT_39840 [Microdochium bolleyi]